MKWTKVLPLVVSALLCSVALARADQIQLKQLGNYTSPDTSAVGRSPASKMGDFISVMDFMPSGQPDGTTNNSTAFQYAATAGCARTSDGVRVYVPAPSSGRNYVAYDIWNTCPNTWVGAGRGGRGGTQTSRGAEYNAANSGGSTTAHMGGTTVNYSAGTTFFMRWSPNANGTNAASTWYTSTSPQQLMMGGGIRDMNLYAGSNDTHLWALQVYGTYNFAVDHMTIVAPYNGMEFYGDEMPSVDNVQMMHTANWNYFIHGDLKGLTSYGVAATAGASDVSTRTDAFQGTNLQNIDNGGTNSTFYIVDMADDIMLDHVSSEGPAIALNVSCSAATSVTPNYDPNLGNCPHFIFTYDFEAEFCVVSCVHATDFLVLRIHNGYFFNQNITAAVNTLYLSSANYNFVSGGAAGTTNTTAVGRVTIDGGTQIFVAQSECIALNGTMYDVDINHSEINGCDTAGNGSYSINTFQYVTHLKVNNNTIGNVDGYVGAYAPQGALRVTPGTTFVDFGDNILQGLNTGLAPVNIMSSNANPGTIHVHDNVGPGGSPTIAAGACGTGGSIASGGRDDNFIVTVGTGTPTSCTITFGSARSNTPTCTAMLVAGFSGSVGSFTANGTAVTFNGTAMSGAFGVICKDS